MTMSIGGNSMPASIDGYSEGYVFNPFPKTVTDGNGFPVSIGYPEITWTFERLTSTEYAWWATTICDGEAYQEFTVASLRDNLDVQKSFTHCVVFYPTFEKREYGAYFNVTVKITQIEE